MHSLSRTIPFLTILTKDLGLNRVPSKRRLDQPLDSGADRRGTARQMERNSLRVQALIKDLRSKDVR